MTIPLTLLVFTLKLVDNDNSSDTFTLKLVDNDNSSDPFTLKSFDNDNSSDPFTLKSIDNDNSSDPFTLKSFDNDNSSDPFTLKSFDNDNSSDPFTLKLFDNDNSSTFLLSSLQVGWQSLWPFRPACVCPQGWSWAVSSLERSTCASRCVRWQVWRWCGRPSWWRASVSTWRSHPASCLTVPAKGRHMRDVLTLLMIRKPFLVFRGYGQSTLQYSSMGWMKKKNGHSFFFTR